MENNDLCGRIDERSEKIGKKIRDAEISKAPYMFIVGEKEVESETISVRKHGDGDLGSFTLSDMSNSIRQEIDELTQ